MRISDEGIVVDELPSSTSFGAATFTADSGDFAVTTTWKDSNSFLAARISMLLISGTLSVCLILSDDRTAVMVWARSEPETSGESANVRANNVFRIARW